LDGGKVEGEREVGQAERQGREERSGGGRGWVGRVKREERENEDVRWGGGGIVEGGGEVGEWRRIEIGCGKGRRRWAKGREGDEARRGRGRE